MKTVVDMLVEPTAHHLCDSGSIYGRNYERNAKRDFEKEPQARLTTDEYGVNVSVSMYHHIVSQLEEDRFCTEFNALPVEDWNGDHYGVSELGQQWLDDRMFTPDGEAQNSYNWENLFDQVIQYQKLERDGVKYILLQIHGGCDVRSGYTDAKLFKFDEWNDDSYWMDDRCTFAVKRSVLEACGYVSPEGEGDDDELLAVDFYGRSGRAEVYEARTNDQIPLLSDFRWPENLTLEGSANAVEH